MRDKLTLTELTLSQNMERIERRMDNLEARWRHFEREIQPVGPTTTDNERERARAYYRRRAEDMRPVMTQEEAFGIEVKHTADVEGLSERDIWFYSCGSIDAAFETGSKIEDHLEDAPPSDSQAEGCQCPCHREGLWKLPDEITRLNAELDTAYERQRVLWINLRNSNAVQQIPPYEWDVIAEWFGSDGKAIRPQENEDAK